MMRGALSARPLHAVVRRSCTIQLSSVAFVFSPTKPLKEISKIFRSSTDNSRPLFTHWKNFFKASLRYPQERTRDS